MNVNELKKFCKDSGLGYKELRLCFSRKRLKSYQNPPQHWQNFNLVGSLAPKLGFIEIVLRNKVANLLNITDDNFISNQTFGFWAKLINEHSLHNKTLDLKKIDFRKYSTTNRNTKKLRNFYKVRICLDLLVKIRNRAFHFENLYKTLEGKPRISTLRNGEIVGILPQNLEMFVDDMALALGGEFVQLLSDGGKEKLPPLTSVQL